MKKACILLLVVVMFVNYATPVYARQFTYTYNWWGISTPSPDAYHVSAWILGEHLGVGHFLSPQDIIVVGNRIYVADTGNHRIVVIEALEDGSHEAVEVVYNIDGSSFSSPYGIFANEAGQRWIADTGNQRILHVDENWNLITEITRPPSPPSLLGPEDAFLPEKLAVDFTGRLFVQARHVNRGLMEFDRNGVFDGYMGAAPVSITPIDQFWRLISTQEQNLRRMLFVPTEYNNVTVDDEGFLFVTNTVAINNDVDPVRRLNAMGNDVLIRNGLFDIEGDLAWGQAGHISGPSNFIDVAPMPNETFIAFDRTRGRLFAYDFQGNLLFVFGGYGNREGNFRRPVALSNMGYTLFALDSTTAAITRFDLTDYGIALNRGLELYRLGRYEDSVYYWQEVLRMNGNFGIAYGGIARALLRQGYYREAMRYFRQENDREGYGRAFGFYRRQWMEDNFWIFALAIGALIVIPPVVKQVLKIRKEIREA